MKKLTVVICTYNRADVLRNCLKSLAVQDKAAKEKCLISVIDNNSKDNTKQIVEYFKHLMNLEYFFEEKIGLSHARNKGIKEAKTDYVCFLDDDAKPGKEWLRNALDVIEKKSFDIFGGPIVPFYELEKPDWFLDGYEIRSFGEKERTLLKEENLSGSNIFFKKSVFEKIGVFDVNIGMSGKKLNLGEDSLIQQQAIKLNCRRLYCPTLVVEHLVPCYKMKFLYILKRRFVFGTVCRKIFIDSKDCLERDLYYFFREMLKSLLLSVQYFFRDKKKYKYWQNYFIYVLTPPISRLGKIYSYKNK